MEVAAIIPARYQSTRFPGKPLADICGRPMIWWVYQQVKKCNRVSAVYVATDNEQIEDICHDYGLNVVRTADTHGTSTERILEVAEKTPADLYICVNGDEPLIDPAVIQAIIPDTLPESDFYVSNLMTEIKNPVEAVDFTNIKVVSDVDGNALFMSRSPIPYPKASMEYKYYKHVGVLIYSLSALRFFAHTEKGRNELIEDVNELRFIEHGKKLKMIEVEAATLSVDTPKDLEKVRLMVQERLQKGVLTL